MTESPLVVAITGASGAIYATRLLEVLLRQQRTVHLSISKSGQQVILQELDRRVELDLFRLEQLLPEAELDTSLVRFHHPANFMAPIASGSFLTSGMVVCPCSSTTLSAIVNAGGNNLIQRAADVHLKEGRTLIVVPRETPLSLVHLENLQKACRAGAVVLPAMPGFYHGAATIMDLVDFVVARILDQLGIEHQLMRRWGEG